jgi:hypothetical protein
VRRRLLALLLPLAILPAAGCGSDDDLDYSLRTPPPYIGGAPIAPPGQQLIDRRMSSADAQRLRPVIADWASAVRQGEIVRAAGFFTLPAIVRPLGGDALQVNSPQVVQAFHASLPCGAKLLTTNPEGRYVVATFVLVDVASRRCDERGKLARIGFVFGDKQRPRRFTEWWQFPATPEATAGPGRRPDSATPATVSDFG